MAAWCTFQAFLLLALVLGCMGVDPCTDYDLLWMEYGRRSSDFYSLNTATSLCDAFISEDTWYRFEADAGDRLIEKPVEPWYCGTQAPIWINGTHPTDFTEVNVTACATYSSTDICGWNGTVRIQLCNESGSEFFVYLLAVPPGCPLAYCVDAASRKNCTPPYIWLKDEFKCGVEVTTTPSPPTTTPTPSSPSTGWGQWGPWTECSKSCGYGVQSRKRTCGQVPCDGKSTDQQSCSESNCGELPSEKDKGIVLILRSKDPSRDAMLEVVQHEQEILSILRSGINSNCSENASLCCGFESESNFSPPIEFLKSDDIYAAQGYPKYGSSGTVLYKVIAKVNKDVNELICTIDGSKFRKRRQAQSTEPNFISFDVMEMAARYGASEILQVTGLVIEAYLDPAAVPAARKSDVSACPVVKCVVPIVILLCVTASAIGLAVACIAWKKKINSKTVPVLDATPKKNDEIVSSRQVHPNVYTMLPEIESQSEKSSLPESNVDSN